MADILIRRENAEGLQENTLYYVMGGMVGDYIVLRPSSISDNGTTVTVTNDVVMSGDLTLSGIPTSDPVVAGAVWSNSGVLTVSAG